MSPATPDDYYDHLPEPGHAPGDIWCGLPAYGALKAQHVPGIVITPACDLANEKSETITYLPILSVDAWFATFSLLTEIRGSTQSLLSALISQYRVAVDPPELARVPTLEQLASLKGSLEAITADAKAAALAMRALSGVEAMRRIVRRDELHTPPSILAALFGDKDFSTRCERLVRNALRLDTYFLPARSRWATNADDAFSTHSVVMFRYPLTAPLAVLDLANDVAEADWESAIKEYDILPAAQFFSARRPLRVARLRHQFLVDMLAKYIALYSRVGSPDFPDTLVSRLAKDIGAKQG
jgi:hypothetical protein